MRKPNHTLRNIALFILLININMGCMKNTPFENGNVINVENEIKNENYQIVNLSEFGNNIEYITLETDENNLIGRASSIFFENNIFYIHDNRQNVIHWFNRAGKYMGIIGNKGGGPKEYEGNISFININPDKECINFSTTAHMLYSYTFNGEFIKRIRLPKVGDHFVDNALELKNHVFLCDLASIMQTQYNYLIYNDSLSSITYIEEELNPIPKWDDSFSTYDMALIWKYANQTRYQKRMDNIIYTFNESAVKDTLYTIQYGKYRVTSSGSSQHERSENSISLQTVFETDQYIFLQFNFRKWAPEPIIQKGRLPDGKIKEFPLDTVCAIYDKSLHKLQLLKHPQKNNLGFYNDLDKGLSFWPQYISSSKEMVMYYNPENLIDLYSAMENPPAQLKEVMLNVDEDSNPIIVLVK